jgi:carbon monoxide dehydrogenase subunit G
MRLENTFDVPAPPERAWEMLMDVPRVIPCMPGAELTETIDDVTWKATIAVKLGPMSFLFASDVRRTHSDPDAWQATLDIVARELRGRGSGQATVSSSLAPTAEGTRVTIVTELTMVGAVAQYGRGLVQPVSAQLVNSFAGCLRETILSDQAASEAPPPPARPVQPVQGLRLTFAALLDWLRGRGGHSRSTNHPEGGSG